MKQRILSMILVAAIVFTSVDITAFAQGNNSLDTTEQAEVLEGFSDIENQLEEIVESSEEKIDVMNKYGESEVEGEDNSELLVETSEIDNIEHNSVDDLEVENIVETMTGEEETETSILSNVEQIEEEQIVSEVEVSNNIDVLQYGDWLYFLDDEGYAHIVGYQDKKATNIDVPVRVGKSIVIGIEKGAFADNVNIYKISIPFYVSYIDKETFSCDVKIQAYNGTYALQFARENGYEEINCSELDFTENVFDYTEIIRANYSYISENEIEMNGLGER